MTLDEAVEEFARMGTYENEYAEQDGTPPRLPVSGLTDPDTAVGVCDCVSAEFVKFLKMNGFHEATVIITDEATDWGYQGTTRHGAPCEFAGPHFAVTIGDEFVDWTATQFIGTREPWPLRRKPNGQP